jgi:UDP-N-acetylmuramoylalanine--D-glutamate ligase
MAMALRQTKTTRALVVGLGLTGASCVRYLVAQGYDVSAIDSRAAPPNLADVQREFPDMPVHTGGFEKDWFKLADIIVVSPGISVHEPSIAAATADGREIVGDIELFARAVQGRANVGRSQHPASRDTGTSMYGAGGRAPGATAARTPVLAVTGSNGKSTVTALVGAMCRAAGLDTRVGGNIGVPALSLLQTSEPNVYVLELSSFQLETTSSLNARAAAILNISADHMDRYRDILEYTDAKARIFRGDGVMVLNADDARVRGLSQSGRRTVRFSLAAPASDRDFGLRMHGREMWLARGNDDLMPTTQLRMPGRHNVANALAAMALTDALGIAREAQIDAARAFTGLPHRTELIAERDGIRWINDSKGTNVGATVAALNGMDAPVVLIAGGDGKGADFGELRDACARHARAVLLIGRDGPRIDAALSGAVATMYATDMRDAVRRAATTAHVGDVVLLSPACASFDMFRNYEHRGDVFRAAVQELLS